MAPGAAAAVDDRWKAQGDSKELHERDTYHGGEWLNRQDLVHQVVDKIGDLTVELEKMGALFSRTADGKTLDLRWDGGHSFKRSFFMENRVGNEMMRGLVSEATKHEVPVYEEIMITELLTDGEAVQGALGFSIADGDTYLFECPSVILATGGAGMVYAVNDNPTDLTETGFALALHAGARLMDMEFVQFYPIAFLTPPMVRGVLACYTYMTQRLINSEGENIMERNGLDFIRQQETGFPERS